jgi:plastocyanin
VGGVANAVVKLEGDFPKTDGSATDKYVLDQIRCEFSPHVLLLPQGATLTILNSEAMLHNVRAFDEKINMLFNDAMPKKGQVIKKKFDEPGRLIFRCGVHSWMHALVIVQEHPYYAVTSETGDFKISGISDGTYTLSVWHEVLGELRQEVSPESTFPILTYPSRSTDEIPVG